jgi:hypothetical protein
MLSNLVLNKARGNNLFCPDDNSASAPWSLLQRLPLAEIDIGLITV